MNDVMTTDQSGWWFKLAENSYEMEKFHVDDMDDNRGEHTREFLTLSAFVVEWNVLESQQP